MAVKFSTCYPVLLQGHRTPCGIVTDQQNNRIQEIICPELPEETCRRLAAAWNEQCLAIPGDKGFEEALATFISNELQRL